MGADRAILVVAAEDVNQDIEPLAVAKILNAIVDAEQPGLVIADRQQHERDRADARPTARLTAGDLRLGGRDRRRQGDGDARGRRRLQTIAVTLPAIVSVDLRLNEPRYASLPNIMKAKKKPLDEKTPADHGVGVTPRLKVVKTVEPATRKAGIKVASVDELVAKLKTEAGVI